MVIYCHLIQSVSKPISSEGQFSQRFRIKHNVYPLLYHAAQFEPISKQKSLPPFIFLEAIRPKSNFLADKVFEKTFCIR